MGKKIKQQQQQNSLKFAFIKGLKDGGSKQYEENVFKCI